MPARSRALGRTRGRSRRGPAAPSREPVATRTSLIGVNTTPETVSLSVARSVRGARAARRAAPGRPERETNAGRAATGANAAGVEVRSIASGLWAATQTNWPKVGGAAGAPPDRVAPRRRRGRTPAHAGHHPPRHPRANTRPAPRRSRGRTRAVAAAFARRARRRDELPPRSLRPRRPGGFPEWKERDGPALPGTRRRQIAPRLPPPAPSSGGGAGRASGSLDGVRGPRGGASGRGWLCSRSRRSSPPPSAPPLVPLPGAFPSPPPPLPRRAPCPARGPTGCGAWAAAAPFSALRSARRCHPWSTSCAVGTLWEPGIAQRTDLRALGCAGALGTVAPPPSAPCAPCALPGEKPRRTRRASRSRVRRAPPDCTSGRGRREGLARPIGDGRALETPAAASTCEPRPLRFASGTTERACPPPL